MLAAIVDWQALGEVVVVSLVGGVGLTAAFSIAVAGAVASVDMRRDGRLVEAGAFAAAALAGIGVCVVAVVYGIGVMVGG